MKQIGEWLAMGGYGWYVWPSYIIGLSIIALNIYLPLRYHRLLLKQRVFDKTSDNNKQCT